MKIMASRNREVVLLAGIAKRGFSTVIYRNDEDILTPAERAILDMYLDFSQTVNLERSSLNYSDAFAVSQKVFIHYKDLIKANTTKKRELVKVKDLELGAIVEEDCIKRLSSYMRPSRHFDRFTHEKIIFTAKDVNSYAFGGFYVKNIFTNSISEIYDFEEIIFRKYGKSHRAIVGSHVSDEAFILVSDVAEEEVYVNYRELEIDPKYVFNKAGENTLEEVQKIRLYV